LPIISVSPREPFLPRSIILQPRAPFQSTPNSASASLQKNSIIGQIFSARILRLKRTHTIGVIAEEIGDAYGSMVISGIEQYVRENNFFFLTVIHCHDQQLLQTYSQMLLSRGVEGFITVDTSITEVPSLPTVAVAGHQNVPGVTNIVLDHKRAARLALKHLQELGHERIAFIQGQTLSSDSSVRWAAICEVAEELGPD
jgi:DNA-binding LacI/PurR family transcriptional regulator